MPNVVVYVKARDAEQFEDPKALAKFVREAAAAALSERGRNAGANPVRAEDVSPGRPAAEDTPRSESDHFKPDPKPGRKK